MLHIITPTKVTELGMYSKQGGANSLIMTFIFYGTTAEQTNKLENFVQQPVNHSHSAPESGGMCVAKSPQL